MWITSHFQNGMTSTIYAPTHGGCPGPIAVVWHPFYNELYDSVRHHLKSDIQLTLHKMTCHLYRYEIKENFPIVHLTLVPIWKRIDQVQHVVYRMTENQQTKSVHFPEHHSNQVSV